MTNGLAIFDWEGAVVCKQYGAALAAQQYLGQVSENNVPIPAAFDLAALYQYNRLDRNPSLRAEVALDLQLFQLEGLLSELSGLNVSFMFGGMCEVQRLRQFFSANGSGDIPCSQTLALTQVRKEELLPQNRSGTLSVADFTPNQLFTGAESLLRNTGTVKTMARAIQKEEALLTKKASEPVYPGVIEEIKRLKQQNFKLAVVHKCETITTSNQAEVADLFDHHERCGSPTIIHKPNPVILRNCIRAIGDGIKVRINDLIGHTFYICSGHIDMKMALTTQSHGQSVGSIHCLYSADDHRFSDRATLARAFLGMINIHPQRVADEKKPDETRRETLKRLEMKYCYQNLSFADQPGSISDAITDLRSRRAGNQSTPFEIGNKQE